MNGHLPPHITNPRTPLVALEGGPQHYRWFFYRDWLTLRKASRRMRDPLDRPCGSSRCYLPTNRFAENSNPAITEQYGEARVWEYIPPAQWAVWGREYLTPEERADTPSIPAPRQPQSATTPVARKQATQPRTTTTDTTAIVPLWTDLEVSP